MVVDTPTGVTTLYSAAPEVPGGGVGPPPGLDNPLPPPVQQGDRNGNYTGTAVPLDTGGGQCLQTQQVGNFRVHGSSVRYGGFRGTIAPDGGLQMVSGRNWIIGQFEGATFHGQLDLEGTWNSFGCTYMLNLARTGA